MAFLKELGQQFGTLQLEQPKNESLNDEAMTDYQSQKTDETAENAEIDFETLHINPIAMPSGISNMSWIKINKIVYEKDTSFIDNLSTIYTALHETAKTVVMVIQKQKNSLIELYLGVSDKQDVSSHISKYVLERAIGGCMPGINFEEQ